MPALPDQRQERFALLVATQAKSDIQAYQEAYEVDNATAHANAWRVRAYEGVERRISELQQRAEDKSVLTFLEKRRYLASVVRTPVGEVDATSPLCQQVKYGKDGEVEYKMPGKIEALKLDAQLMGELVNRAEVDVRLAVYGAVQERPVIDIEPESQ